MTSSSPGSGRKRCYSPPRVADAGSLRDLTFGGDTSVTSDSGMNNMQDIMP